MGLVYAIVVALCIWIVGWAFKMKAIDSFLIAAVIIITAVAVQMLAAHSPAKRRS